MVIKGLAVALLLGTATTAMAAAEREISQDEADRLVNTVAAGPGAAKPDGGATDCIRLRDGKCAVVTDARQLRPRLATAIPINFLVGSAELTAVSRANLAKLGKSLSASRVAFFVDGHTDRSGSCSANMDLSRSRAESAVGYLAGIGVDRSRMTPRGFGYTNLKDSSNPRAEANRRVEIVNKAGAAGSTGKC